MSKEQLNSIKKVYNALCPIKSLIKRVFTKNSKSLKMIKKLVFIIRNQQVGGSSPLFGILVLKQVSLPKKYYFLANLKLKNFSTAFKLYAALNLRLAPDFFNLLIGVTCLAIVFNFFPINQAS